MAEITVDRVLEVTTSTGAAALTLGGAIAGYRAFSAVCVNGDTFRGYIEAVDVNGIPTGDWEVGIYTWGTGGVIARTIVQSSSNAGSAVVFAAGNKRVGLGVTAPKWATLGGVAAATVTATGTLPPSSLGLVTPVNAASAVVLTLPDAATSWAALPYGLVLVSQKGVGIPTFAPAGTDLLRATSGVAPSVQYSMIAAQIISATEWALA